MNYFFFLFAACVSALAATLFTLDGVFGSASSFPAVDATFFDVVSLLVFLVAFMGRSSCEKTMRVESVVYHFGMAQLIKEA